MRTKSKNHNKHHSPAAASVARGEGVTMWETRFEVISSMLDKAAILGLVSYAVAITLQIAEIV